MSKRILAVIIFVLLALAGGLGWYFYKNRKPAPAQISPPIQQNNTAPAPMPQNQLPAAATLYYPMTSFAGRITVRTFGQLVRPTDVVSPCGAPFSGYHDADDLEVTTAEVNAVVPVYAIADGVVREVGPVSGYGGLLVLGVTIGGQSYTAYYGHIDLGSTALVVGQNVSAGQKIANLGAQCSVQTGGERKHLHFAIHTGTTIDVRGYVPTLGELAAWVDPKAFLADNSASIIQ